MITDPRILAHLFTDLRQQVLRWTTDVSEAEDAVIKASRSSEDSTNQIQNLIRNAATIAGTLENRLTSLIGMVSDAKEASTASYRDAYNAEKSSNKAVQVAQISVDKWSSGLSRANSMLDVARQRLSQAEADLTRAQNALTRAQNDLNSADRALSSCRNSYRTDSRGNRINNDCSSQAARYHSAQAAVSRCQDDVNSAYAEVQRAMQEVQRCESLVQRCEQGLDKATNILTHSRENYTLSTLSISSAQSAQSEATVADEWIAKVGDLTKQVRALVDASEAISVQMNALLSDNEIAKRKIIEIALIQREIDIQARVMLIDLENKLGRFDAADGIGD